MTFASALPRPRVLTDAIPGHLTRDLSIVVGSAAVVSLAAQVTLPLPFTPVPLSLQTLAVLLIGAATGPARSVASMTLYVLVGVAGAPVFAGGASGWGTATFGYALGFILAAPLVGALAARGADRTPLRTTALMVVGNTAIYTCGVTWLTAVVGLDLSKALLVGVVPFLVGDLLKIAVAAGVLPTAWRMVHGQRESTSGPSR
jgi:biotin transport system substrate-specific component